MLKAIQYLGVISCTVTLVSCSSDDVNNTQSQAPADVIVNKPANDIIQLNQLGYLVNESKTAITPNTSASQFAIINKETGEEVYKGQLSQSSTWNAANGLTFKVADFSTFTQEGTFYIRINGIADSYAFTINNTVYSNIHDAALKSYYLNRAALPIEEAYAGKWARPAGHYDQQVIVHASAADNTLQANDIIASSKGWYDAGDFGKYTVNSAIATYTLLAAFDHHQDFYTNRNINIPESGDNLPDILNEIKWNLDWLSTMQSPEGGVFHKLTTLGWPGEEMPHQDTRPRYVIEQSTSAALDFAATMAMASRVFKEQGDAYQQVSQQWLAQAERAWHWAKTNPVAPYKQPEDVRSGEYGDKLLDDEFLWASAELFISTGKKHYLTEFLTYNEKLPELIIPQWAEVAALGYISLLNAPDLAITEQTKALINTKFFALADKLKQNYEQSSYRVAMQPENFIWGSNSVALNQAFVAIQAYNLSQDQRYKDVAIEGLSYVLGRNPTGYSFVTGFGDKSPQFPHHRASEADGIVEPVPGMLVGGAYAGQPDPCTYQSKEHALSYVDHWCSYATNEIAINWNAPLVYVLAAVQNK